MALVPFAPLDDTLSDSGDLVSVEVFQQIAHNCNYFIDSMPIGSVIQVMTGDGITPTPDPTIWQECDGSIVTNQASPLRDNPTPNYADVGGRYMRGYVNPGTIGFYGGSNTRNLTHNHGGTQLNVQPRNADTDDDFTTAADHSHPIDFDLPSDHNMEPAHFKIKHYIKIT